MALGSNHLTQADLDNSGAGFVPERWSDEIIAAYKANIVMGQLVAKIDFKGKKGDVLHIPNPTRGSASSKSAETQVTLVNPAVSEVLVNINKHYEYSFLEEDLAAVQALDSARQFYTDDAGYALAKQIDQDIMIQGHTLQGGTQYSGAVIGGDGSTAWDASANSSAGNASALTDAGLRTMIQTLDDADVPMANRRLIVPPVEKKNLTGIPRFTEQAFIGEMSGSNTIRNGLIGDLYGIPVYVTSNCPWVHIDDADSDDYFNFSSSAIGTGALTDATGTAVTVGTDGGTHGRVGMLFHRDAIVHAPQMGIRVQKQYKQEYLGDLFTADTIYGVAELRDTAGIAFIVPTA